MRLHLALAALAAFVAPMAAQDKVTLSNGDVLTGVVKSMLDGELKLENESVGEIIIPMDKIANLSTADSVRVLTNQGELLDRRIAGIEDGKIKFGVAPEGAPAAPSISIDNLDQINPPEKEPPSWTGSFRLNAGIASGNTDRRQGGFGLNMERRTDVDRITVDASWDYAEDKQMGDYVITQRRAGGGAKYDYFLDDRWYVLATTRVLGDTLADLDLRFTAGLGLGHQVVDNDTISLLVELGLSYLNENYRSNTPSVDYLAARVAYKLRYAFNDDTRLLHGIEAFPSVEDSDNVYFQMNTELQTNLSDSMVGSLVWTWDYDNTPAPDRERSDHRVFLSVGWNF